MALNIFPAPHPCNAPSAVPYQDMVESKIILNGIAAFVVEITGADGSRSIRRFPTEAAALMWIAEQGPIDDAAETEKGGA